MAKRSKKTQKPASKSQEMVVVIFAEDMEEAKGYQSLLKSNDIPAVIEEDESPHVGTGSITVMVPEEFIDEAHIVIESQDAYDDFYDLAMEDQSDDVDFNGDFFDDNF